jgi:hypothetical protein
MPAGLSIFYVGFDRFAGACMHGLFATTVLLALLLLRLDSLPIVCRATLLFLLLRLSLSLPLSCYTLQFLATAYFRFKQFNLLVEANLIIGSLN